MTKAGELSHRVSFQKRTEISDDYGNTVAGPFTEQFVVSAKVQAKFGGETVIAARLQGEQPVTIVVRQNSRTLLIKDDWRAVDVHEGTEYAIRSIVDPDDSGAFREILCQSGVAP